MKNDIFDKRLKVIWNGMKNRCYDESHVSYKYYGNRGIKICTDWHSNFSLFKEWSLANGYEITLTLDRIDTFGNYEPSNCRWATKKEQQANRRDSIKREYNGKMLSTGQICDITGKSYMSEYLKSKRIIKKMV